MVRLFALLCLALLVASAYSFPSIAADVSEEPQIAVMECPVVSQLSLGQGDPNEYRSKATSPPDHLSAPIARQLTFYRGPWGDGVLAPRGWQCVQYHNAYGKCLVAKPDINDTAGLSIVSDCTTTSVSYGRFQIAGAALAIFPGQAKKFVQGVLAEGLVHKEDIELEQKPYPLGKLKYRNERMVEFQEAENHKAANGIEQDYPTPTLRMIALLGHDPSIDEETVTIRVPQELEFLRHIIASEAERRTLLRQ